MRRRRVLEIIIAGLTAGSAGYSGISSERMEDPENDVRSEKSPDWSPTIESPERYMSPGEKATLSIEATDVSRLSVLTSSTEGFITFDFDYQNVSPPPDYQDYSYPPGWYWSSRRDVELEVPVELGDEAPIREYHYEVRVWDGTDETANSITEEFSINVTN